MKYMHTKQPSLSVVVVAHNMPRQAMNTLYSLSSKYQKGITSTDYEVIVMENDSGNNLEPSAVAALGSNFHYTLRQESGVSPARAINEALQHCKGTYIGLLIDGARMLTPRVIFNALRALSEPGAVVTVPGYYLSEMGRTEHGTEEIPAAKILHHESSILEESAWRDDGYRLFLRACFSNGNKHGYLEPMMECNALFCSHSLLNSLGGADERFNLSGGGALNLHLYRQIATAKNTRLITLPGEGNFHQFHAGTSTTPGGQRDELVSRFKNQLDKYWPGGFRGVRREPAMYGPVGQYALPFLQKSAQSAATRFQRFQRDMHDPWEDEP